MIDRVGRIEFNDPTFRPRQRSGPQLDPREYLLPPKPHVCPPALTLELRQLLEAVKALDSAWMALKAASLRSGIITKAEIEARGRFLEAEAYLLNMAAAYRELL